MDGKSFGTERESPGVTSTPFCEGRGERGSSKKSKGSNTYSRFGGKIGSMRAKGT